VNYYERLVDISKYVLTSKVNNANIGSLKNKGGGWFYGESV